MRKKNLSIIQQVLILMYKIRYNEVCKKNGQRSVGWWKQVEKVSGSQRIDPHITCMRIKVEFDDGNDVWMMLKYAINRNDTENNRSIICRSLTRFMINVLKLAEKWLLQQIAMTGEWLKIVIFITANQGHMLRGAHAYEHTHITHPKSMWKSLLLSNNSNYFAKLCQYWGRW